MTIAASLVSKNSYYQIGNSGPGVTQIQLALRAIGYPLKGTGYFGPATDVAVETFQKRAGLVVDGKVGLNTATMLDAATAGARVPLPATMLAQIGRPLWLEAGIKLIGTKEVPGSGDNPKIIDWAKQLGGNIAAAYTHDSIPWCALFANHCLTQVGLKGTGTLWALDFAGKWPSVRLLGPAVGAFTPMLRDGGGHIIQIVGRDQHGNIMGLGGNQNDMVSIVPFPISRLNKGYWWPSSVPIPQKTGLTSLPVVQSNGNIAHTES